MGTDKQFPPWRPLFRCKRAFRTDAEKRNPDYPGAELPADIQAQLRLLENRRAQRMPDLDLSYAVGRAFWAAGALSERFCNMMFATLNKIVMGEEHPWNQLEWQIPLPPLEEQ